MKPILTALFLSLIQLSYAQNQETFTAKDLATWQTYGIGKTTIQNNELIVEETDGSDGFFLVSPKSYGADLTITYKVKALSESAVQIVLLSASDPGASMALTLPTSEDLTPREVWTWRTTLEHYNLTFNNKSHGIKPFFFKNVSPYEKGFRLDQAENVMVPGQWYDVKIIKKGTLLSFTLNGETVFEVRDHEPLSGGHLMLRISGTNGDTIIFAKAAYKDFVLTHG